MRAVLVLVAVLAIIGAVLADVSVQSSDIQAAIDADPVLAAELRAAAANGQSLGAGTPMSIDAKIAAQVEALNRAQASAGTSYAARVAEYRAQARAALGVQDN